MDGSRPVYQDERGWFSELWRRHVDPAAAEAVHAPLQVSASFSRRGVVRGLHVSPYAKLVTAVHGSVWDVAVDVREASPTYGSVLFARELTAANGAVAVVPAGCAHGFLALDDCTIVYVQAGTYDRSLDWEFLWNDPAVAVPWPLREGQTAIVSAKDAANVPLADALRPPKADCLLLGASGYLGMQMARALDALGVRYVTCSARLEDRAAIEAALALHRPSFCICAAGTAGRPNIAWCDTHQAETIRANVLGQLNVVDACLKFDVHVTLIGSGAMYNGTAAGGRAFAEDDPPQQTEMDRFFYVRMRVHLETLLASYSHVLNLRVMYPLSGDGHERSLLSKLLRFPTVISQPISLTVTDSLFPIAVRMAQARKVGTFHLVNKGTITHDEILQIYREHVDGSASWTLGTSGGQAAPKLATEKLEEFAPELPSARDAVTAAIRLLARPAP